MQAVIDAVEFERVIPFAAFANEFARAPKHPGVHLPQIGIRHQSFDGSKSNKFESAKRNVLRILR